MEMELEMEMDMKVKLDMEMGINVRLEMEMEIKMGIAMEMEMGLGIRTKVRMEMKMKIEMEMEMELGSGMKMRMGILSLHLARNGDHGKPWKTNMATFLQNTNEFPLFWRGPPRRPRPPDLSRLVRVDDEWGCGWVDDVEESEGRAGGELGSRGMLDRHGCEFGAAASC